MSVVRYLLGRVANLTAVVLLVTVATWLSFHVLKPAKFPPDERSMLVQLGDYLQRAALHLDLGRSWTGSARPVAELIAARLPADLWLLAGAMAFGLTAGLAGGAVAAAREGTWIARTLEVSAALFLCTPVYVVGLGLLLLFGRGIAMVHVGVEIPTEYTPLAEDPGHWLGSLIVPWIVLGLPLAAICLRMMRGEMLGALEHDSLRTATAKGLRPRRVVGRHATRLAMAPTLTLAGVSVPLVVTNLVLVEKVFAVPGMFQDMTQAMGSADFPLLMGMTITVAALVALATFLVDVALAFVDPTVRTPAAG
jgi:peptide/nickel transport system permease protein